VWVQRAAEGDVHHLHPSADAEGRHCETVGRVEQRDLELVPVRFDPVEVGRRRRAGTSRLDVAPADQQQGVEWLQDLLGGPPLAGSEDRGPRARPPQRLQVRLRDPVSALRPSRDAIAAEVVGDDGDERSIGVVRHRPSVSVGFSRP
jgi:hypothetical protein